MTQNMKLDPLDLQILAALDAGFIVDESGELASVSDCKIEIVRIADDKLQLTVEFANLELPIVMLRTKTLETLGIKGES